MVETGLTAFQAFQVFQAGTPSGNPIATASGIATLKQLRDHSPYDKLEVLAERLASGLAGAADAAGIAHTIGRVGSMMTLFFNPDPVTNWDIAAKCDTERFAKYFWGLIDRGVYMPCSQYEALFISAAHTDADIDETVKIAKIIIGGLLAILAVVGGGDDHRVELVPVRGEGFTVVTAREGVRQLLLRLLEELRVDITQPDDLGVRMLVHLVAVLLADRADGADRQHAQLAAAGVESDAAAQAGQRGTGGAGSGGGEELTAREVAWHHAATLALVLPLVQSIPDRSP